MAPGYYSNAQRINIIGKTVSQTVTASATTHMKTATPIDKDTDFKVCVRPETSMAGNYKYEIYNAKDYKEEYDYNSYFLRIDYGYANSRKVAEWKARRKIKSIMRPYLKEDTNLAKFVPKFFVRLVR